MGKAQTNSSSHMQSLSADEQRLFRLYGKLPNKKDLLQNKLKVRTRTCISLHHTICPHSLSPSSSCLTSCKIYPFPNTNTLPHTRSANTSTRATTPSPKPAKPPTPASPPSAPNTPRQKTSRTSWPPRRPIPPIHSTALLPPFPSPTPAA